MDAKIMQRFAYVLAGLGCAIGCQRGAGSTPPAVSEEYRADIANLCDVVARSGADQLPDGERAPTIATWLGSHLTTEDAHAYLIRIQTLVGEPKAAALEAEATRVGLGHCALADEWRKPP